MRVRQYTFVNTLSSIHFRQLDDTPALICGTRALSGSVDLVFRLCVKNGLGSLITYRSRGQRLFFVLQFRFDRDGLHFIPLHARSARAAGVNFRG